MAVMKQIDECLDRFFSNKRPLAKKWQARGVNMRRDELRLYHYHHLVLAYDVLNNKVLYEWWEKPADKRGLESAKEWLEERWRKTHQN
jgi:hypothetical protein